MKLAICYSYKHFMNCSLENQQFISEQNKKSVSNFKTFTVDFLFLFSNKILVFSARIHKMLVRTAYREDWFCTVCLGLFGRQLVFETVLTISEQYDVGIYQTEE